MSDHLESRPPSKEDLVALCRELNDRGANYVIIGGFAMMHAGYPRFTADVDLLVETGIENERKVLDAVATLPDHAAAELHPGEIEEYRVVRVADEIVVDLLALACGVSFGDVKPRIIFEEVDGVTIPFAAHEDLWRMKATTHREKDQGDLVFLKAWFESRGIQPPQIQ